MLRFLLLTLILASCSSRNLEPNQGLNKPLSELPRTSEIQWTSGNQITTLINGKGFYPPMLEAIRSAKTSITFETFVYVDAQITTDFTMAMGQKAREGVKVHVILDAVGSNHLNKDHLTHLRQAGAEVHLYHPFNILQPSRSNNRTHRKILVVDGHTAFTGGAGFAHAWIDEWRDTQYQITGPSVAQIQDSFAENWQELTGKRLTGTNYFPPLRKTGPYRACFISDSPRNSKNPLAHGVLHAVNAAKKSLILEQSYFIPNRTFRKALLAAAKRGVKIEILVPSGNIDSLASRYASQNHWRELLQAGILLYQYPPKMLHGKLLIADRRLSIIGSGNFDDRSFFINDEVNLHVLSSEFAREQEAMFRQDLRFAQKITLQNLSSFLAPWPKRAFSGLISSQL